MMERIRSWYLRNATEITWFLIGWLSVCGLQDLSQGDYVGASISWGLAYINYSLYRK